MVFTVQPTRSGSLAEQHLGLEAEDADGFDLTLSSDAFAGYDRLEKKRVKFAGCWVHAR